MASNGKAPTGRVLSEAEFNAGLDWVDPGTIESGDNGDGDSGGGSSGGSDRGARTASEFTGGRNKDGSPTRKRGRKPGSGTGPRKSGSQKNVRLAEVLASSIVTVSALAANHFSAPEWEFDKDEAEAIGKATQDVTELYTDIELPAEIIAWGNLAMILAGALGPRMYMTMDRLKTERMRDVSPKPNTPAPAPAVVMPATPEFVVPQPTPQVDPRPQAPQPPTGAELNKSLFPDQFSF